MDLCNALEFLNRTKEEQAKVPRTNFELAITLKPSDELIGVVGLTKVNEFEGTGTIGYWLEEKHWRKGFMTEAANRLVEFAFNELNLRRLNAEAWTNNDASNTLLRKLGFRFEGVKWKGHRSKATGEVHDCNFYGLLAEEWSKKP